MKSNLVPNKLSVAACLSLAILLTGCFDTKQEYTLNPDGSGKVVHESTFQHMNLNLGGPDATDPQARLVIAASQPGVLWLDMVSLFP